MHLDSFSLLVAASGLMVLLGSAFLLLWVRDRASRWLLWWGIPMVLNGIGLTLYMRAGWQTDLINIAFGNALRIFTLGCLWYGIRAFEGRRPPWGAITAITCVWLLLCLYPPFLGSMTARIVAVSLLHALICALAVAELWRARGDVLRSRLPTTIAFASYGVMMLVRVCVAGVAPFPVGAGPLDPLWLAAYTWLVVGHGMFAGFFFLAMTMERREAEQRNFAMSDPLTGLMNRRAFGDFAQRLSRRRSGMRESLGLLVLDLDQFKRINDQFGHDVGDRMLKAFAEVSEQAVRPTDQLFRMGGEEFCFVLPETSLDDTIAVAERVRRAFEGVAIDTPAGPASTTVSIGIAVTEFGVDIEVLLAAADAAVYEAKARGRNRVIVADPSILRSGGIAPSVAVRRRA